MGKKFKVHKKESIIKKTLNQRRSVKDLNTERTFVVSFHHFDGEQSDTFKDWEKLGWLSKCIDTLSNYCKKPLLEQVDKIKFTIYGDFPPKDKTDFSFPPHIPEDAKWARIHITGKQCLIGHIVNNIFYIVFLDGEHKFWKSTLKNT